jgi:hypothetical protein
MAQFEEVHTTPARKDGHGHYYIDGDLVVATKEAQNRLLVSLEPVWKATVGYKTVVVGPMARYVTDSCCDDPDHITNRKDADFEKKMKKDLFQANNIMREYFRSNGHQHCRIIDPAMDILKKSKEEIWGDDPTIPKPEIYDSLVAAIPMAVARIEVAKRAGEGGAEPMAKRPRQEGEGQTRQNRGGRSGHAGWTKPRGGGGGGGGGSHRGESSRGGGDYYGGRRWGSQGDRGWTVRNREGGHYGGYLPRDGNWRQPRRGGGRRYGGRGYRRP